MISELYTFKIIMQSEMKWKISLWYLWVEFFMCVSLDTHTWIEMKWFNVYNQYYMRCLRTDSDKINLQIESLFDKIWLYGLTMQKVHKEEVFLADFIEWEQWIDDEIHFCYFQIKSHYWCSSQCWFISLHYLILNLLTMKMMITLTLNHLCCFKIVQKQHELLEVLELLLQVSVKTLLSLQTSLLAVCSFLL